MIDPRYPFYQQTFRLLGITNKQHLGKCCVVLDAEDNERLLPLAVTDRSPELLNLALLPISLDALQKLVVVYTRIHSIFTAQSIGNGNEKSATRSEFSEPSAAFTEPTST